jgi:phage shock protein C
MMSDNEVKQIRRSKTQRMIAGVCGGLGDYFGIDPVWFRLGFVVAALPGGLPGIVPYLICWVIIPEE